MAGTAEFAVLLVEDDDIDVMHVQRVFRRRNLPNPLLIAHDGVEALSILRGFLETPEALPQVVLLDLNMPRMNGFEFLRELRSDPRLRDIRVVVLTSSDDDGDIASALSLDVADYLVKPLSNDQLAATITAGQAG